MVSMDRKGDASDESCFNLDSYDVIGKLIRIRMRIRVSIIIIIKRIRKIKKK